MFHTTRWTQVVAVKGRDAQAREALAGLCAAYWFPVYGYLRRSGRSKETAEDLTQGFFAVLVEKGYVEQADRTRGRFRTFLVTALRHYVANEHDAATAQKRGGGRVFSSLEFDEAEPRYDREPRDTQTPEELFEAAWAREIIRTARQRLLDKHADGWMHGSRFFEPLVAMVIDGQEEAYPELAARLDTSEGSLRVIAHRIRQQFGLCLRDVVADTVQDPASVDEELRYLLAVLRRT